MFCVDVVEEVEDAAGVVGDAVVRPRLEVEVEDPPLIVLQRKMVTNGMNGLIISTIQALYRVKQQVT